MKRLLLVFIAFGLALIIASPVYADTVYIVQPGDTLYRIASRFGVTQAVIMAFNGLSNPNVIFVGERLVIPGAENQLGNTLPISGAGTYIVQPGDTLYRIAMRFGVGVPALMEANHLTSGLIYGGQTLTIPGITTDLSASGPIPVTPPTATVPTSVAAPSATGTTYLIQPGDTLWRIASKFGITVAALKSVNGLVTNTIFVGQTLVIPVVSGNPQSALPSAMAPVDVTAPPNPSMPPWIPVITAHMRQIYQESAKYGQKLNVFTVAGDCNSEFKVYLGHGVDLLNSGYGWLDPTRNYFAPSFANQSVAAHGGFTASGVVDSSFSPVWCNGEGLFTCELINSKASIVFILLGTGEHANWRTFETHYRYLLWQAQQHHVLPVVVTKLDETESKVDGAPPHYMNNLIRQLAHEYEVPLLDFWQAAQGLPNGGLQDDIHVTDEAMTLHLIATLQTLAAIR